MPPPASPSAPHPPRFHRLAETGRPVVHYTVDGQPAMALEGDTLLVALLTHGRRVRDSEFGDGPRAGFCMMGACQDCWVWRPDGARLRACSTTVTAGLAVCTRPPASHWPVTADLAATLEAERAAAGAAP